MNRKRLVSLVLVLCLLFCFSSVAYAADGGGIFSGLESIANFIKRLFVPDKNYFHNQIAELNDLLNSRFGGVAYLYQLLHHFFTSLGASSSTGLTFTLPNNYFFPGFRGLSIDFLQMAKPYVQLLRDVLTAAYCLLISVCCYHRLRTLFRE